VVDEAFGMGGIRLTQDGCSSRVKFGRSFVMDCFGRQQADAGVAIVGVVPAEELLTEGARLLDARETLRKARAIPQCFELGLRIRIVVGDVTA